MADRQDRIRQRAHEIWEQEGRPDGRDQEHWERAHREVDEEPGETPPEPPRDISSPDDRTAGKPQQAAPTSPSRAKR